MEEALDAIREAVSKGFDPIAPLRKASSSYIQEGAFIFVVVVLLLIIGYGIAHWIWGEE